MRLYDQHLHSRHSFDSQADPEDVVRKAIEEGLAGVTFTEHYDTHPDEVDECVFDYEAYSDTVASLREKFGDRIVVGKGIEVDYQRENMSAIVDFLDVREFDAVLLSVHWCYDIPIHLRAAWEGKDPVEVTRRYFQAVRDAVGHVCELHAGRSRVFDVLAHMDFVKRYSLRYTGASHVVTQVDLIDEILAMCVGADLVPEINTSTLRQGIDEAMPGLDVVRRYAAAGGTMMSIGSDAHKADDIGADFDTALGMLRDAGISSVAVYEKRERRAEPIDARLVG